MAEPRVEGTRERIQAIALDLFAEQGYEKTSLREIADRLGVTKAALYYHFKTKDDIVRSALEDFMSSVDDLIEWGTSQPATLETRKELLRRYADLAASGMHPARFFQQNPTVVNKEELAMGFRERVGALQRLLRDPDSSLPDELRAMLALISMHMTMSMSKLKGPGLFSDRDFTEEEIRAAALEVAFGLLPQTP